MWNDEVVEKYIITKKDADRPWSELYNEAASAEGTEEVRKLLQSVCSVLDKQRAKQLRSAKTAKRKLSLNEDDSAENRHPTALKRVSSFNSPVPAVKPQVGAKPQLAKAQSAERSATRPAAEVRNKRVLAEEGLDTSDGASRTGKKRRVAPARAVSRVRQVYKQEACCITPTNITPQRKKPFRCDTVEVVSVSRAPSPERVPEPPRTFAPPPLLTISSLSCLVSFCMQHLGQPKPTCCAEFCELEMKRVPLRSQSVTLAAFRAVGFQMGLYLDRCGSVDYFTRTITEFAAAFEEQAAAPAGVEDLARAKQLSAEMQPLILKSWTPVEDSREVLLKLQSLYRRYLGEYATRLRSLTGLIDAVRQGQPTDFVSGCKVIFDIPSSSAENQGAAQLKELVLPMLEERIEVYRNESHASFLREAGLWDVYILFGFPPTEPEASRMRLECRDYCEEFFSKLILLEEEEKEKRLQELKAKQAEEKKKLEEFGKRRLKAQAAIQWLNNYGNAQVLSREGPFLALGIQPRDCTEQLLTKIKRKLLLIVHPDKLCLDGLTEDQSTNLTAQANSAFKNLTDCLERASKLLTEKSHLLYRGVGVRAPFADDCEIPTHSFGTRQATSHSTMHQTAHQTTYQTTYQTASQTAYPATSQTTTSSTQAASPSPTDTFGSPPVRRPSRFQVFDSLKNYKYSEAEWGGNVKNALEIHTVRIDGQGLVLSMRYRDASAVATVRYIKVFVCYPYSTGETVSIENLMLKYKNTPVSVLIGFRLAGIFHFDGPFSPSGSTHIRLQPVPIVSAKGALYHLAVQEFHNGAEVQFTTPRVYCFGLPTHVMLSRLTKDELIEQLRFFSFSLNTLYESSFSAKEFSCSALRGMRKSSLLSLAENLLKDISEHVLIQ
eukprot:Gregarina_sp_Pseudo_9__2944@NODE_315_length_3186_cov_9_230060_g296_i0_p1_GENE_NODE_315_length_3186_cov_9_230060_g296_i0NODE_315_length_3186_cov_9_230060_g296_i0_p1_ORF_typecomplete_len889_score173_67DnaJ/PF00226_31/0_015Phage_HK97_TLTM/PF06120_11/1_5e03Phage_HK97_TLTM/PF06120_11/0_15Phage_HK97_TLTM/PF06120_11/3_9e02MGC24/PF05283_11/6_1e03MGC24/PF05283_11/0_22Podoplanin/PF05808_11/25_NODE_315_length_3186_cov_9_230060_g296_i0542720